MLWGKWDGGQCELCMQNDWEKSQGEKYIYIPIFSIFLSFLILNHSAPGSWSYWSTQRAIVGRIFSLGNSLGKEMCLTPPFIS